jgi:hypothetical protein
MQNINSAMQARATSATLARDNNHFKQSLQLLPDVLYRNPSFGDVLEICGVVTDTELTMKNLTALLVASALAIGITAAVAQSNSENRGTAYGQGGTAGTHSTGANVGPGRAEQNHTTGN